MFAVARRNSPSTVRIKLEDTHKTEARVIGEARSLPLRPGLAVRSAEVGCVRAGAHCIK